MAIDRTTRLMLERDEAIRNDRIVAALLESGDSPESPREVDHFVFFSSRLMRTRFKWWAIFRRFAIASVRTDRDSQYPHAITLVRTHAVDPHTINPITTMLALKAISLGGEYDGWGCPVTSE